MGTTKFRYPGTTYFQPEDEPIFCGRDADSERLYTQVMLSRTLVLHADSGVGKSSLIEAGLLPRLRRRNPEYLALTLRFDFKKLTGDAATQDSAAQSRLLVAGIIEKISSALSQDERAALPWLSDYPESLWTLARKLARSERKLLLLFDQFEELQQYSPQQVEAFTWALHELLRQEPPEEVGERIRAAALALSEGAGPDSEARADYNRNAALLRRPLDTRVLFVVREDKLGTMSLLGRYFPDILKNDFPLHALSAEAARSAIIEPALQQGNYYSPPFQFEEDAVAHLLSELSDPVSGLVDPMQVQIVCRNIERKTVLRAEGDGFVVQKTVVAQKDIPAIGNIIEDFYNDCWQRANENAALSATNYLGKKSRIDSALVVNGRRNLVHEGLLCDESNPDTDRVLLGTLVKEGLLRKFLSGNDTFYQLCHDRFIRPVQEDHREQQQRLQQALQLQESRRKRKLLLVAIGGAVLLLFAVVGSLYFSARRSERFAWEDKIYTVATLLRRENPTLSYNIARQWNAAHPDDARIAHFLQNFDSLRRGMLIGYFPLAAPLDYASIVGGGDVLTTSSAGLAMHWRISDKSLIDVSGSDSGMRLQRFQHAGVEGALLLRGDSLLVYKGSRLLSRYFLKDRETLHTVAVSSHNNHLLIDGTLYNFETGRKIGTIPRFPIDGEMSASLFLHDGKHLVCGFRSGASNIYCIDETRSGNTVRLSATMSQSDTVGHTVTYALAVDSRDRLLVAGSQRGEVEVWQIPNLQAGDANPDSVVKQKLQNPYRYQPLYILKGHTDEVTCVSISASDSLILSGSTDKTAILWHLKRGTKLAVLNLNELVTYCNFSSDSKTFIVASNRIISLWSRQPPASISSRLASFSPLDYYLVGLGRNDEFTPYLFDTTTVRSMFGTTMNYLLHFPLSNDYPSDRDYLAHLREGIQQVEHLYYSLQKRPGYAQQISGQERVYLRHQFNRVEEAKPFLLLEASPSQDTTAITRQKVPGG